MMQETEFMVQDKKQFLVDSENKEFLRAYNILSDTKDNIFLTGKAGTGKTTFLKTIKREIDDKEMVVLAPTGIAAINCGGQTINSFFHLPFKPFLMSDYSNITINGIVKMFKYNKKKLNMLRAIDVLVIDEISMVRCDVLDILDLILKKVRNRENEPFGGVQMLLIGDNFQLPPVVKNDIKQILSNEYDDFYFFNSFSYNSGNFRKIELKKIYRQSDDKFISILNRIRTGDQTKEDIDILNSKKDISKLGDNFVTLSTHNVFVDNINKEELSKLDTETFKYTARISGEFKENMLPCERELKLKVGAQVIFIKNDSSEDKNYYNGKIGTVITLSEKVIKVKDEDDKIIFVTRETWENIKYDYDGNSVVENKVGKLEQYPLKLAWALTVHKSQGLTFDSVMLDLGNSFTHGQVYVALSRCTNMDNLYIINNLVNNNIIVDKNVLKYNQQ